MGSQLRKHLLSLEKVGNSPDNRVKIFVDIFCLLAFRNQLTVSNNASFPIKMSCYGYKLL